MHETTEDMKQAFVNYADQTVVEDVLQNVYPFIRYEMARIPYLAKTALSRPGIWSNIQPEGRYWEATDDGYVPFPMMPWRRGRTPVVSVA